VDLAGDGDEVEMESCFKDCARSLSGAADALLPCPGTLLGGDGDLEYGDAIMAL
jgi:hypothetical protein